MEENPYLKSAILEVVENQLKTNDPPETRKTLKRLTPIKGYIEKNAKPGAFIGLMAAILKQTFLAQ